MNHAKTFRLFISSTFSDFKTERQVLHEKVFPEINKFLETNHPDYTFQAIDLRWGVSAEAQLDQKTLDLCLNEVKSCKHYLHPNFLIMAGNRYGWVPLPYAIEKEEFEHMLTYFESKNKHDHLGLTWGKVLYCLHKWYKLDINHVPASYVLMERNPDSIYSDYKEWEKVETTLRKILQEAVEFIFEDNDVRRAKYFRSATEAEVDEGIFKYLEPTNEQKKIVEEKKDLPVLDEKYVFGFFRNIQDIQNKHCIDYSVEPYKTYIDKDQKAIVDFRNNLIKTGIKIKENAVSLDSTKNQIFQDEEQYLKCFEKYIYEKLIFSIQEQIKKHAETDIDYEQLEQERFRDLKVKTFIGRDESIKKVKKYIDTATSQPLLVHGISGIGKSAFMAKLTQIILDKIHIKEKEYPVYFRFIGTTSESSEIHGLLKSLVNQLSNEGALEKPSSYETETYKFFEQIKKLLESIQKPVIVVLDALDQLRNKEYPSWLPEVLPENLKIILSVLDEGDTYYWDIFKKHITKNNQLKLEAISSANARNVLNSLLIEAKRNLTPLQKQYVLDQIAQSGNLPLYIRIAFEEVKTWRSFDDEKLSVGIEKIIKKYINNLTKKYHHHPKDMVCKVLGWIKASNDGLSEKEILDLLSRDDRMLNSLEKFDNKLTLNIDSKEVRRFPTSVWARLYEQLKPFLMTRLIDGQNLIKFFHRQIDEVVGRYIYETRKIELHTELADYFLTQQDEVKLWDKRYYNPHMLDELPYHLFESKDSKRLKEILFDLEFAGSIYDHQKQSNFRDILEQASQLDGISEYEIYPWESFYREKEHFISSIIDEEWSPHQTLFQYAFEDGLNSSCHKIAKHLISRNKINWKWFQKQNIDEIFSREVEHVYKAQGNEVNIHENFNCIALINYYIFYYYNEIYIFSNDLKFIKKLISKNPLKYFKSMSYGENHYVIFENVFLKIFDMKYNLVDNYQEKIFKNITNDIKVKSVFYKNEIYYLVALTDSTFEKMCYEYDVVKNENGIYDKINYEAMVIDKSSGIVQIYVLGENFTLQKIVDMKSVEEYIKIITSDNDAIYYYKNNNYYMYDKNGRVEKPDNKPPEDKVKYCANVDSDVYSDDEVSMEYYSLMAEHEAFSEGEYAYNEWRKYNDPYFNIESKTVKLTSAENCERVKLVNYGECTYRLNETQCLSIFERYILIINTSNSKQDKNNLIVEKHINQFFNQSNSNDIYLLDEQSYVVEKENKLQIFNKDVLLYESNKEVHDYCIYGDTLVILLKCKQVVLHIDITHIDNLKIQSIDINKIKDITLQEKDILRGICVATSGKIVLEYSRYVEAIEEDYHRISEDEYESVNIDRSHWEDRLCFLSVENNLSICEENINAPWWHDENGDSVNILLAIDDSNDSEVNHLIYHIYGDQEGYSYRLNDNSRYSMYENVKKKQFSWEYNIFISKKRLIRRLFEGLKIYDLCHFKSVHIENNVTKFLLDNNQSIYYVGDIKALKFFHDKVMVFDGKTINFLQFID